MILAWFVLHLSAVLGFYCSETLHEVEGQECAKECVLLLLEAALLFYSTPAPQPLSPPMHNLHN